MLDHLLFNKKKWYQGELPNYIGKYVTSKNDITGWRISATTTYKDGHVAFYSQGKKISFNHAKIDAEYFHFNELYLHAVGQINNSAGGYDCDWFKPTDVTVLGGVIKPLICFITALRRVAIA